MIKTMTKNVVLYYETIAFEHFEKGPALEIHGAEIEGPLEIANTQSGLGGSAISPT